uniref:Selenide, water dikinase n=1 Tax=Cacopsylla melanoneura TaxID=428564 RepID=A0A8D9ARQ0_9HEMI
MGAIACANVLSDIYAVGVTDIDALQMIVGVSTQMTENERNVIVPLLIQGFKAQATIAGVVISKVAIKENPWMTIGGVVSAVCSNKEFIIPNQAIPGDVIILTKPLGTQMAVTIRSWLTNEEKLSFLKDIQVDCESLKSCINSAISLMATINKKAAILMKKYNGHACTDVTGYGLYGHASNLIQYQTQDVNFEIHTLPILYPLGVIASHPGTRFYQNVNKGLGIETSGGLFICLPEIHAKDFIREMDELAWIIGKVTAGDKKVVIEDEPDILHVTLKS